ncbi:MAG: hypothetical protein U9N46_02510, partial [Euryarchaeota archaeon]|nr:hypothetical protein [Euryarchaeota archaeon]
TAQSANVTTKWIHKSFVPLLHNSHLNDAFYGHDSGKSRGHNLCGVTYIILKHGKRCIAEGILKIKNLIYSGGGHHV